MTARAKQQADYELINRAIASLIKPRPRSAPTGCEGRSQRATHHHVFDHSSLLGDPRLIEPQQIVDLVLYGICRQPHRGTDIMLIRLLGATWLRISADHWFADLVAGGTMAALLLPSLNAAIIDNGVPRAIRPTSGVRAQDAGGQLAAGRLLDLGDIPGCQDGDELRS